MMISAAKRGARLSAIGTYAPSKVLTNDDLSKLVDTTDEWIVRRTGIRERRIAADDEFTSDLCTAAARDALTKSGTSPDDVGLVIAGTTTPDYPFPSVACQVQDRLGLRNAGAIDIQATCAGFAYGLHIANGLISAGIHDHVLVVAGETLSKVTDYTDRATCILFGDGAGAAVVEAATPGNIRASIVGANGEGGPHLYRTGLSRRIASASGAAGAELPPGLIRQNGREVYRWAVETVSAGVSRLMHDAGLSGEDIDWFIPHSANIRITESVCERTGIPVSRTLSSIECYGNTSAATIPLALAPAIAANQIRRGDTLILYGFGGGLVHAGLLLDW
ncbi:MAG: ketoacyl-ACP synthase III [Gemmatimonadales bacterium]